MKLKVITYISVLLIVAAGCSGYEKVLKSNNYRLKYETALKYYNDENYYRASVLFDQIATVFRGTEQADTVYFYQAMSYFHQGDNELASYYFQNFSRTWGRSKFIEEADYHAAYCNYLDSPRPELDQTKTETGIQLFQLYEVRYPNGKYIDQVKEYMKELTEKLVEKSYLSAKLYLDLELYKSAVTALNQCLLDYPESSHREQIMYMILKSNYFYALNSIESKKKERYQTTLDEYYSFKSEFPESDYSKDAERIFNNSRKYLGDDVVFDDTEFNY